MLQKYNSAPTLLANDRVLRCCLHHLLDCLNQLCAANNLFDCLCGCWLMTLGRNTQCALHSLDVF